VSTFFIAIYNLYTKLMFDILALISTNFAPAKLEEPKNQSCEHLSIAIYNLYTKLVFDMLALISSDSEATKSEESQDESGPFHNVLAISAFVLNQLSFVAQNSPIPGLSTAAYLALTIVTNVQVCDLPSSVDSN
jgi:hypothetical protein